MASDNLQKTQDAIDNVIDGGQEYQSGRKRVRRPEMSALFEREKYLDKKDVQTNAAASPGCGRFRANFNHSGNNT